MFIEIWIYDVKADLLHEPCIGDNADRFVRLRVRGMICTLTLLCLAGGCGKVLEEERTLVGGYDWNGVFKNRCVRDSHEF